MRLGTDLEEPQRAFGGVPLLGNALALIAAILLHIGNPFGGFALDALFDETDNIDVVVLDS